MFDDLRQQAGEGDFKDQEEQDTYALKDVTLQPKTYLLGMTPVQRFVIALMLLMMVCILGTLLLLVTERIVPPFIS